MIVISVYRTGLYGVVASYMQLQNGGEFLELYADSNISRRHCENEWTQSILNAWLLGLKCF